MRIATVLWDRKPTLAAIIGDSVLNLPACAVGLKRARQRKEELPSDMLGLLDRGSRAVALVRGLSTEAAHRIQSGTWRARARSPLIRPIDRTRLLAPIPRPRRNVFCVGRNYAAHAEERRAEVPAVPVFFTKPPTSVIGHGDSVIAHRVAGQLDYEVELAVVIGRGGMNIRRERAYEYVFGYTVLNDVTARDLQTRHLQWFKGKSLDGFCPMGPWIVHKSAVPDPHALRISLRVNGEVRQAARTADMIFRIPELIEVLSAGMSLEPGDILATGTPAGVAAAGDPPGWLRVGDVIEAEIEGIGVLRNRIVAPSC